MEHMDCRNSSSIFNPILLTCGDGAGNNSDIGHNRAVFFVLGLGALSAVARLKLSGRGTRIGRVFYLHWDKLPNSPRMVRRCIAVENNLEGKSVQVCVFAAE